jgi:hypothetical protein
MSGASYAALTGNAPAAPSPSPSPSLGPQTIRVTPVETMPKAAPASAAPARAAAAASSTSAGSTYYVEGMADMTPQQYREALERKLRAQKNQRAQADPYGTTTGPKAADNYMAALERQSNDKYRGGGD